MSSHRPKARYNQVGETEAQLSGYSKFQLSDVARNLVEGPPARREWRQSGGPGV